MRYLLITIVMYVFSNIQVLGQDIDTVKLYRCHKIVAQVDSLHLRCDTLFYNYEIPSNVNKIAWYDKKGILRKYTCKNATHDGANEYMDLSAYYDIYGNLVYIKQEWGNHCEDGYGWFWIHNERIIDYFYNWDCGCCEDETPTEEERGIVRPAIGDSLERTCDGTSLKNFMYADRLLKVLKDKKYSKYAEFEVD